MPHLIAFLLFFYKKSVEAKVKKVDFAHIITRIDR
jgi:hypothetical protein